MNSIQMSMENIPPEKVEKVRALKQSEVEKAEIKLRSVERQKSKNVESSKTATRLKDVKPNSTYEKNGYTYQTDHLSRTIKVSGFLHLKPEVRKPKIQDEVRRQGKPGDQAGHVIGRQFEGPPDAYNLFPQNGDFNAGTWNKSSWANMEREWKDDLQTGKKVNVTMELQYKGSSKRPYEIDVHTVTSDGKSKEIFFLNRSHDQIKYYSVGQD